MHILLPKPISRVVGLAMFSLSLSCLFAAPPAKISKPNIILILADDLGYGDLSLSGQKKFQTPHIDSLAKNGIQFTQMYSGASVCAPARSSLMTGQTTGHTPIRGNFELFPEGQRPLPAATETLPELLKKQGYATGAFGKWGLGYPGSEGDPLKQGFDKFFGWNCQRIGHHYYPHHLWDNETKVILEENAGKKAGLYAPKRVHEKTLEFIAAHRDQPFFCYVPSIIPHADLAAPEEYVAKFRGKFGKETPYVGYDDGPDFRKGPYESAAEPKATFAAMVTYLDDQVGEIIAKVNELGIADRTLIIFTSDNGPHREGGHDPDYFDSTGPLRGSKRQLYEGGIRIPFLAQWPGAIQAGSKSDLPAAFWDLSPTFAQLAGGEAPSNVDGVSIVPTLLGQPGQKIADYLYWEFHEEGGRQAVRKGDWKAIREGVAADRDAPIMLFNLTTDLGETTDVAAENPEIVAEMAAIMKQARTESEIFKFKHSGYLQEKK